MQFRAEDYGAGIARILSAEGSGERRMPLVHTGSGSAAAQSAIQELSAPASVKAGLYLYCSCWDEAHTTADSIENPDGYFWHAIVHRQEPDPGNSAYWFRKAGTHPVYPQLASEATACGYPAGGAWDPFGFIDFCERARRKAGTESEDLAMRVQLIEWQLLFAWCARSQRA